MLNSKNFFSSSFQADNFQLKLNYFVIFLFFGSGIFVGWLRWILVDVMNGMECKERC
jgi:hypothetical protein